MADGPVLHIELAVANEVWMSQLLMQLGDRVHHVEPPVWAQRCAASAAAIIGRYAVPRS
jgi:hypothetical protein